MQDMGYEIFVQSDDRNTDGFDSLYNRANGAAELKAAGKDKAAYAKAACDKWIDVRAFGQVFAFSSNKKGEGVSVGVRGPVSIQSAFSIEPVDITSLQITKSVNGEPTKDGKKSADTMGMKHRVDFGIYKTFGSINCQLAEKTGFTDEDAEVIKKALLTLFENDCSSARPEGSMEILRLVWWRHNSKIGQYSSAKVHKSLQIEQADEDVKITVNELPDLKPEIYDGL